MFKSPIVAVGLGALVGFILAKVVGEKSFLGDTNYPGIPSQNYFGRQRSMAIMTTLRNAQGRRPGLGSGSGPQIPQFEFVDPQWARIPSMMYPEGSPNFIGRDHWNMPRTSKPPPA
jgi:hypothetical protein